MKETIRPYRSEFEIKNKIARFFWSFIHVLFFNLGLRNTHGWRVFLLKVFGSKIKRDCKVYKSVKVWAPWNLYMEENTCLGDGVDCYSVAPIHLGKNVVISQDACLCAATHDYTIPDFTLRPKMIEIEEGAWVCARAFIGPGVTVGRYAVVGACAVVTKDVPAYAVVAGNPASVIKWRDMSAFPFDYQPQDTASH